MKTTVPPMRWMSCLDVPEGHINIDHLRVEVVLEHFDGALVAATAGFF